MKKSLQQLIEKARLNPKNLFLFDGLGALLSAFLLGIILVQFNDYFGMPKQALYFLAFLPCLFAIYDFVYYFRINNNWRFFLKGIAIINFLYCCISIIMLFFHFPELTILGLTYFIIELIIVIVLAVFEWWVAKS